VGNRYSSRYPSVLLLGVVPSLTWAVARCLRCAGGAPLVLGWHRWSPMQWTNDCRRYLPWEGLVRSGEQLDTVALWRVRDLCRGGRIDAVMGADYDTALLLADTQRLADIPACAVPTASTISTFNNKWNLVRLLDQLELPHPPSRWVGDAASLLATDLPFPMITKPLDMWASVGFQVHDSQSALAQTIERGRLAAHFPLIAQAYVPGWDVGASFLASSGRLVAYSVFQHRRRGERVFYDSPRVRDYVDRFVSATGYSGVGHLDLRYDPQTDRYAILELNPRFWASLLYARRAGVNYPDLLLRAGAAPSVGVLTARPGTVRLPWYEALMTVTMRWAAAAYERSSGVRL